jgi:hypothetical protein
MISLLSYNKIYHSFELRLSLEKAKNTHEFSSNKNILHLHHVPQENQCENKVLFSPIISVRHIGMSYISIPCSQKKNKISLLLTEEIVNLKKMMMLWLL